ncbi:MAG TPA: sugar ABC transporter permease [Actinomycetota bacterium]|nr:sugar ABC transporter permease [Actinomycetota bacterium]
MTRDRLAWPYLAGLAALVAIPALAALALAFTDFGGIGAPRFVGADNFARMVGDEAFWRSLANSLLYVAMAVPVRLSLALAFALLLARRARGAGAARASAYLPTVVPDAALALVWLWLLNPLYGPLPVAFEAAGIDSPGWLTEPWAARVAIAAMGALQIGEAFVVALAARRAIPARLYEAAAVDGASAWYALRRLTLPMMAPVLGLLALRDVLLSFQVGFVPALLVTDGGPRYATTYLPLYAYRMAFRYFRLGYASAITTTLFVLTALVVVVQYRLARRWRP